MAKNVYILGLSSDFVISQEIIKRICNFCKTMNEEEETTPIIGNGLNINIVSSKDNEAKAVAELIKQHFKLNHEVVILDDYEKHIPSDQLEKIMKKHTRNFSYLIIVSKDYNAYSPDTITSEHVEYQYGREVIFV